MPFQPSPEEGSGFPSGEARMPTTAGQWKDVEEGMAFSRNVGTREPGEQGSCRNGAREETGKCSLRPIHEAWRSLRGMQN